MIARGLLILKTRTYKDHSESLVVNGIYDKVLLRVFFKAHVFISICEYTQITSTSSNILLPGEF